MNWNMILTFSQSLGADSFSLLNMTAFWRHDMTSPNSMTSNMLPCTVDVFIFFKTIQALAAHESRP